MDISEKYEALVNERCAAYSWDVSDHVKHVMKSMLMGRDKLWMCGSFSEAVIANNLGAAVRQADDEMVKHLKHMVIARDNFFTTPDPFEVEDEEENDEPTDDQIMNQGNYEGGIRYGNTNTWQGR